MPESSADSRAKSPSIFDGFSCPWAGSNTSLLHFLAVEHAQNVVGALAHAHEDCIRAKSAGLLARLEEFAERGSSFETVWDQAFGEAHAFLLQPESDPVWCAASIGLRLSAQTPSGEWHARFDAPQRLRFNNWVLPMVREFEVCGAMGALTVRGDGPEGSFLRCFTLVDGAWMTEDAEEIETVGKDPLSFRVLYSANTPQSAARRLLSADAYAFASSAQKCSAPWRQACERAAELIAAAAPYVSWVSQVVRFLIPVASEDRVFNSGSERFSPGVICMSDHGLAWAVAEMLVHESSHQYMNLLTFVDPLVNGSDERLYYSPFRRKDRPLFFILAAYHAFGNVLAFYRAARAQGLTPDEAGLPQPFFHREAELSSNLESLANVLSATDGLTEAGESLWQPLCQHLN